MKEKNKKDQNAKEEEKEMVNKDKKENLEPETIIEEVDELTKAKKDHTDLWNKFLMCQADFENYKKRSYKERMEFIKYANEGLIMELLGIVDNFERGVKAAELKKDFDLLHKGVDMILKQLHTLLESKGLKKINTIGEKFDPHQHEAMEVVEDDEVNDDVVVDELQAGYTLDGRIIRPAKVKVHKTKEKKQPKNENTEGKENK